MIDARFIFVMIIFYLLQNMFFTAFKKIAHLARQELISLVRYVEGIKVEDIKVGG